MSLLGRSRLGGQKSDEMLVRTACPFSDVAQCSSKVSLKL